MHRDRAAGLGGLAAAGNGVFVLEARGGGLHGGPWWRRNRDMMPARRRTRLSAPRAAASAGARRPPRRPATRQGPCRSARGRAPPGGPQRLQRPVQVQGRAPVCFDSFSPFAQHQRRVQVARRRQAELALQQDLPRRVAGQVFAADDVADALRRIVDDDRQLVGEDAVGAAQHEVADAGGDFLALPAEPTVVPDDRLGRPAIGARGRCASESIARACRQAAAAGARIDALGVPCRRGLGCRGEREVAPAAAAGIGPAVVLEPGQRPLVERDPIRLSYRRRIGQQAAARQLAEDGLGRAGDVARPVQVLDAHQPAPALGPRIEPRGQRRDQRAGMEQAGGRGREAADVGRHRIRSPTRPPWRSSRALRVVSLSSCSSHQRRASPSGGFLAAPRRAATGVRQA